MYLFEKVIYFFILEDRENFWEWT